MIMYKCIAVTTAMDMYVSALPAAVSTTETMPAQSCAACVATSKHNVILTADTVMGPAGWGQRGTLIYGYDVRRT